MIKEKWTGDSGTTRLGGGEMTTKDSMRVDAYGDVDELNSFIGLARAQIDFVDIDETLAAVQRDLFVIGAELAKAPMNEKSKLARERVQWIESAVKKTDMQLPELKKFILPGGSQGAALLHASRTVCRRAERKCVLLKRSELVPEDTIKYLNRLSSLLFSLARLVNKKAKVKEHEW